MVPCFTCGSQSHGADPFLYGVGDIIGLRDQSQFVFDSTAIQRGDQHAGRVMAVTGTVHHSFARPPGTCQQRNVSVPYDRHTTAAER